MRFGRTFLVVVAATLALVVGSLAGLVSAQVEQAPLEEVVLPARVEAEAFDTGGEGVAFHEVDPDFAGNVRLDEAVDVYSIRTGRDLSGSPVISELIGRTRDGEWVEYTVEAAAAAEFEIKVLLASGAPAPGTVTVEVDGVEVGTVDGDTGAWFNWTARSAGFVALDGGEHVVRLTWNDGGNVNVDAIEITSTTPTCDTGVQQAEDASINGRFVEEAYSFGGGGSYVEVPHGSGGWWRGEGSSYIEFCVGVEAGGQYAIDALVHAPAYDGHKSFYVSVDGGPLVEFVTNRTNNNDVRWDMVNDAGITEPVGKRAPLSPVVVDPTVWDLTPGDHSLRFYLRQDGIGLDAIQLSPYPRGCSVSEAECAALEAISPIFSREEGDPCWRFEVTCENGAVVELDYGGRGVGLPPLDSLPPEIGDLTSLEVLILPNNDIETLPPEIGNLTNLTRIFLNGNELATLPPEIGNLTNLDYLVLQENEIASLPAEIGDITDLTHLLLRDNQLVSLPPAIGDLSNLEQLYLEGNQVASLPPEIGGLTNLTWLSLQGNPLTTLPDEFVNLTMLEDLFLDSCVFVDTPELYALLDRLAPRWNCSPPDPQGSNSPPATPVVAPCQALTRVNVDGDLPTNPAVGVDGLIYYTNFENNLWVHNPASAESTELGFGPATTPVVADDGTVYFWVVGDFTLELTKYDPATGEATGLGIVEQDLGTKPPALIGPDGIVYTFATGSTGIAFTLFSYDPTTEVVSEIDTVTSADAVWADPPAIGDDGLIYLIDSTGFVSELWQYDPVTDALVALSSTTVDSTIDELEVGADGVVYFAVENASQGSELWTYNPADGSAGSTLGASMPIRGLAVAPDGVIYIQYLMADNSIEMWVIDPVPGEPVVTDFGDATAFGQPTIAPDGRMYVVAYDQSAFREDIWVYDACSSGD